MSVHPGRSVHSTPHLTRPLTRPLTVTLHRPRARPALPREELLPRLRGRLHQGAFLVSFGTGLVLVLAAPGGTARAAASVYALSVTALFGTSALYHRRSWSPRGRVLMQRLDHSMIFVLIAGTYTPLAVLLLPDPAGTAVLLVVWVVAVASVGLRLLWRSGPGWLVFPLSVLLGAVALAVLPDLWDAAGPLGMTLIVLGSATYLSGMTVLIIRRPDPWPAVFGYHEVFHLLTLVAGLLFFALNLMVVTGA